MVCFTYYFYLTELNWNEAKSILEMVKWLLLKIRKSGQFKCKVFFVLILSDSLVENIKIIVDDIYIYTHWPLN